MEAELIAMSAATREIIFLLRLIRDTKKKSRLRIKLTNSRVNLTVQEDTITVHEDNMGTIALAQEYRIRPRTKHINTKYWHFTKFMEENKDVMKIQWIPSKDQLADILTKPLGTELHGKFTHAICGWHLREEKPKQTSQDDKPP